MTDISEGVIVEPVTEPLDIGSQEAVTVDTVAVPVTRPLPVYEPPVDPRGKFYLPRKELDEVAPATAEQLPQHAGYPDETQPPMLEHVSRASLLLSEGWALGGVIGGAAAGGLALGLLLALAVLR